MSYIRSLSNPEGLYIWSDGEGTHICHCVDKPLSSGRHRDDKFVIPSKDFDRILQKWAKVQPDKTKVGQLRVEERHIFVKTGKRVPLKFNPLKSKQGTEFLIRLSYKRDFVYMWRVTWEYIVRNRNN